VAGHLLAFAGVGAGEAVLDVGTGTGVVAISAARAGARVTALDLSPDLLDQARENGRVAQHEDIAWVEGDAEALPYPDGSFDVVLSQFGHIFAPRPDVVIAEMRRVLAPNGRIAAPTEQWGDPAIIADRLGARFGALCFERGIMAVPALSVNHYRLLIESTVGPMQTLVERLATDPQQLSAIRADYEALIGRHFAGNVVRHDYLLTQARAR